jgi:hypothetical protein
VALEGAYALDVRDLRRRLAGAFLLLLDCDVRAASYAFDDYGHGALTADGTIQYAEDPAAAADQAAAEMKKWVTVI